MPEDPTGSPTPTPTPTPSPTPTPTPTPPEFDPTQVVESLKSKHGDANGAILELVRQTHSLREKNRDLVAKVPKEGDVVLSGDAATQWSKYKELGAPSDLRKRLDEGETHKAAAEGLTREKTLQDAAKLHGFESEVLVTLAKGLEVNVRDELDKQGKPLQKDGKPVRKAYVKDGDKEVALDDYAVAKWASFLPALKPAAQRSLGPPARNNPAGPPPTERKPLYSKGSPFS